MRLFVQSDRRRPQPVGVDGAWILLLDTWNDYSFRTQFSLHRESGGEVHTYGAVKILKQGQDIGETPLPTGELAGGQLPDDYGSLGNDLDYYIRLNDLDRREKVDLLTALRDIGVDPARRGRFAGEPGLRISLNRDHPQAQDYYEDVVAVVERGRIPAPRDMQFAFTPDGGREPIEFDFRRDEAEPIAGEPSRRLIVLVGENGVGKTRLLAALARSAYAAPDEREALNEEGHFEGEPAFPGVVTVSYSAFDDFDPPRLGGNSDIEVARQLRDGEGRYAYCGMRDIARWMEAPGGRPGFLSLEDLRIVFGERVAQIRAMERMRLLARVLEPVLDEVSFARHFEELVDDDDLDPGAGTLARLETFLGGNPSEALALLSSGHQIVLHLLTSMTATLKRHGLALIDEPEIHLHPPLLAALMSGIRRLLGAKNAYAIVATHSPVVVQETLSSQVIIMEPGGVVRPPAIQTFGENTGTLTREIFGLHTDAVDYRRALSALADRLGSVEAIEEHLRTDLSPPALAFVTLNLRRPE